MAISTQCNQCGKRYNAGEHMAGKRVRCKQCGNIFALPAASGEDEVLGDLSALAGLEPGGTAVGEASPVVTRDEAAGRSRMERPAEDPGEFGLASPDGRGAPRRNLPFHFPFADVVDQWLPLLLAVGGAAWVAIQAIHADKSGSGWGGYLGAVALVGLFAGVVVPITMIGIKTAANTLNYELPQNARLRLAGVFALPFVLACVFWLIAGDMAGLMSGLIVGMILAVPAMWLLLRLRRDEMPLSFAFAGGAFVVSAVIAGLLLAGMNLLLFNVMLASKASDKLVASPFGPGLSWPKAAAPEAVPVPKRTAPAAVPGPVTPPETTVVGTTTAPSDDGATPNTAPPAGTIAIAPAPTPGNPAPVPPSPPEVVKPAVPTPPDVVGGTPAELPTSPFGKVYRVASDFVEVIRPLAPSPWVAVVKRQGIDGDVVQRWSLTQADAADQSPLKSDGEAKFANPFGEVFNYQMSPNGDTFVRILTRPISLQALSFSGQEPFRIDLSNSQTTAEVVGFSTAENFLVHYESKNNQYWLDIYAADPRKTAALYHVNLPSPVNVGGNLVIRPDGKAMAALVRFPRGVQWDFYALPVMNRLRFIPAAAWQEVAGSAFSSDGKRIVSLLRDGASEMLVSWPSNAASVDELNQKAKKFTYESGIVPGREPLPAAADRRLGAGLVHAPARFNGSERVIDWLGDGAWLVYGEAVISAEGGDLRDKILSGVSGPKQQWVIDATTCLIAYEANGVKELVVIKLDKDKLPAAKK